MIYYEDIGDNVTHRKISTNTLPRKGEVAQQWGDFGAAASPSPPFTERLLSHISRLLCGCFLCRSWSGLAFCRSSTFRRSSAFCRCRLGRIFAFLGGLLLGRLNLWVFPWDSKELLKLIVFVSNVKSIIVPTILLPVEDLGWEHVPLTLLLHCICPHKVSLLLHAGSGYVAELDSDAKAFKDHGDSVLGVLNLLVPTVAADEYLDGVLGDSRGGSWGLCLTHLSCRSESSNKS